MTRSLLLILGLVTATAAAGQPATTTPQSSAQSSLTSPASPPPTRVEPVTEKVHGVEIVDSYRWLEGDDSNPEQMGEVTDEVAAWTDAQNAYTRNVLDRLPGRKQLEDELRPLMEVGSVSRPAIRHDRYFFSKREGDQNQPVYYWREGPKGTTHVLLDPERIDASGLTTVTWISPSPDGNQVAYGTYVAGDENTTLHLFDVMSGETLPLEIPNKTEPPDWLPDGSGFVYGNLADPKNPYSGRVMFHRMGQPVASDDVLFRQYTKEENEKLATTWGPGGTLSRDGRWLTLIYWTGTRSNDLWVADFAAYRKSGKLVKRDVLVGGDGTAFGETAGDRLFVLTNQGAPNGKILVYDLKSKKMESHVFVAEREDAVIQNFNLSQNRMVVEYLQKASSVFGVFDMSGEPQGELKLPGIGSGEIGTEPDRADAYLQFTSFNYPTTIFRVDLEEPRAEAELWERPDVPVDPTSVVVNQVWYTSKDGTKVSMFLVHKKGLHPNGSIPTMLTGYGGFNISRTPAFSPTMFQWYDAGGLMALPNLRGGGEYGDAWHAGGMLDQKQNVFDDFIAAAEWLVAQGWTRPEKLAIAGGSNGGLLTGAAITQRPDLFRVALVAVPLLDMLRYQDFLMARYWVPEYGSAEDTDQFKFLYAYSPYHHVKKGVHYPAVLLTAGENDARVHPMHARKMAALLQASTASPPSEQPVLLWVDREAGHGQGKPLNLRIRDVADQRILFMWQLGMLPQAAD